MQKGYGSEVMERWYCWSSGKRVVNVGEEWEKWKRG